MGSLIQELQDKIDALEEFQTNVLAGNYVFPTALGPNSLSKSAIKARSVTGTMIDVQDLQAVQTKTGNLTVNGALTIATGGSLKSGKTGYSDVANAGYFVGIDGGIPKIRVGNIGGSAGFTWDGTALDIKGVVTATSGTIAGWTIGTTDLKDGAGVVGLASSGSVRIWSGNVTPASAPFRVTSAGAMTSTSGDIGGWVIGSTDLKDSTGEVGLASTGATRIWVGNVTPSSAPFKVSSTGELTSTSGSIGGWTIDSSGLRLGTSTTERGIDSGTTAFYAGGSTTSANFKVTTAGVMTSKSGDIGGWTIDSTGMRLGVGATERGMDSGSVAFYAGGTTSTAKFKVTTTGAVTASDIAITGGTMAIGTKFSVDSSGNVNASNLALSGGSLSLGTKFSVDSSGNMSANSATMTSMSISGTATFAASSQITLPSGGKISDTTVDLNSGTISGMTVDGTLTVHGGVTIDSANGGKITLNSAGTSGDAIKFQYSGTDKAAIWTSSSYGFFGYGVGTVGTPTQGAVYVGAAYGALQGDTSNFIGVYSGGGGINAKTTTSIGLYLGDTGGTNSLKVYNSSNSVRFLVASNGAVGIVADATNGIATGYSTLGSLTGRWAIYNASGTLVGYIPVYTTIT